MISRNCGRRPYPRLKAPSTSISTEPHGGPAPSSDPDFAAAKAPDRHAIAMNDSNDISKGSRVGRLHHERESGAAGRPAAISCRHAGVPALGRGKLVLDGLLGAIFL